MLILYLLFEISSFFYVLYVYYIQHGTFFNQSYKTLTALVKLFACSLENFLYVLSLRRRPGTLKDIKIRECGKYEGMGVTTTANRVCFSSTHTNTDKPLSPLALLFPV